MSRGLSQNRKNTFIKALRKRNISKEVCGVEYDNLHQYSKNKIHCSCPLCSAKTNNKAKRNGRNWSPNSNWKPSDLIKIESLECKESEFYGLEESA